MNQVKQQQSQPPTTTTNNGILVGENSGFDTKLVQFAYQIVTNIPQQQQQQNQQQKHQSSSQATIIDYTSASKWITSAFTQKFGGDWLCVLGRYNNEASGAVFSYYVPSIRHLSLLLNHQHVVFIAQIFEAHMPSVTHALPPPPPQQQ